MNFSEATMKLAGTYLAIIMIMSIGFSLAFYQTAAREFNRPIPPQSERSLQASTDETIQSREELILLLEERSSEARQALQVRLVLLNLLALISGSVISYVLARLSLRPIEENVEAQSQFVSDASHELRTPLTVIQTTNEVAMRKKKISEKEARELLAYNIDETKKLQSLSNALLDLLKNDTKIKNMSEVSLQDVVARSMDHVVEIAQEKNISIDDQVPQITAKTDPELLARLLSIFLDNAVKYSENNKQIIISAKEKDSNISISVADQGIGIKSSDLQHVFRRFYRADKSRTRTGKDVDGYGLGLSIAEKIASQINAKLSVESKLGEGSTFRVTIPASNV